MTHDSLDELHAALDANTPAPNSARKSAHLTRADEIFDQLHQGSPDQMRPTSDRPFGAFSRGAAKMIAKLTTRPGLTATTAIVAVGFVAFLPILEWNKGNNEFEVYVAEPELLFEEAIVVTEDRVATGRMSSASAPPAPSPMMAAEPAVNLRTKGAPLAEIVEPGVPNTENFANAPASSVKITTDEPVSTFSIDVDTASYAVVRSSLMNGFLPDPDAVRIEEMVNYFPYDYPAPEVDGPHPFQPTVSVLQTPWNPHTRLMQIAIQGAQVTERPPLNLVFLIDTSGSMEAANKLPLLKQSFRLMLGQLRPQDQVAIVTYAGSAGRVLDPTPASDRTAILGALDRLSAGGSTAGQEGLELAYATAESMAAEGTMSRVLLATDGDFNLGISDPDGLSAYVAKKRDSGTYLSVLGFGRGNLNDATMQALAQSGNGQAAYIDTLAEAQKTLVDQLSGALFPIADDVKIQVEFNPAHVAEYRLIGYETRALRREDFNNDRVDAGEIGAGHQVTALYEVTPVGSPAVLNDRLRFATTPMIEENAELAFLRLRYKILGATDSRLIEHPITAELSEGTTDAQFAAAIAGFGQLLRGGTYLGDWGFRDAVALAQAHTGADPFGYRREAIQLIRLAESLEQ